MTFASSVMVTLSVVAVNRLVFVTARVREIVRVQGWIGRSLLTSTYNEVVVDDFCETRSDRPLSMRTPPMITHLIRADHDHPGTLRLNSNCLRVLCHDQGISVLACGMTRRYASVVTALHAHALARRNWRC